MPGLYPSNIICPNCERPSVYYIGQSNIYAAKCINCGRYIHKDEIRVEKKRQTNGDKIRSMSDEELSDYLEAVSEDAYNAERPLTSAEFMEWLKEEVGE